MEGVGEDTPHRQGRGGEGPAGPVWVAQLQQCRVSCLYSSVEHKIHILERDLICRKTSYFSQAICDQASGHTEYHKVPNERYGQDLCTDTP